MLSAIRTGAFRAIVQGNGAVKVLCAAPSREIKTFTKDERVEQWDYVNSIYFGPERDTKNFPTPVQALRPPPVRMGFIPNSWFDFFYPKTGVTGPYLFLGGLGLWMLSKEIMVIDHYFWEIPSFWGMIYIMHKHPKIGPKIAQVFSKYSDNYQNIYYTRPLNKMREVENETIGIMQRKIEETESVKHLYQAMQEGVQLQLESAYRQRLQTAYQEVKKRLDYEVEKTNVKRKFEQEHMVNWIVSNVTKSITAQQEKDSIKSCIQTLNRLSAKQALA
ncbi:ATP synthase subunit b, mitochondrial-like [Physella acuta]|uniref:ATP synthase subunit b, mitochondrial-like n=1 Tax=Physella acuta TaxID=109671 RepID=UPI0027DE2D65|nr:ATP synthase subunit b, mitochondrial-like [Physella acuta]